MKTLLKFSLVLLVLAAHLMVVSCSSDIEPLEISSEQEQESEDNTDMEEDSSDDGDDNSGADDQNDGEDQSDGNDGGDGNNDQDGGEDMGNEDDMNDGGNNGDGSDSDEGSDGSSDDENPDDSAMMGIVGDWMLTSATIEEGTAATTFNNIPVTFPFTAVSMDENATISFSEDPNLIQSEGTLNVVTEFTILGQEFSEQVELESPIASGTWRQEQNDIIITDEDAMETVLTIEEMSDNTLMLRTAFDQTFISNDLEIDAEGDLLIVLERIVP